MSKDSDDRQPMTATRDPDEREPTVTDAEQTRPSRRPQGPAHARRGSLMQTMKRTWSEFSEDNLTDSAAALTYYAILSIFPALLAMVAIVGLVGGSAHDHQGDDRPGDLDRSEVGGADVQGADRRPD